MALSRMDKLAVNQGSPSSTQEPEAGPYVTGVTMLSDFNPSIVSTCSPTLKHSRMSRCHEPGERSSSMQSPLIDAAVFG